MLNYVNSYRYKLPLNCDSEFANVVLLLPMTGANASTTFTDVSYYERTVSRNGDAKILTTHYKWDNSSGYFDGNGDYLTVPNSTDFQFGTGDFTIEFWIKTSATGLTTSILSKGTNEMVNFGNLLCRIGGEAANKLTFFCNPNSGNATGRVTLTSLSDVTTNQWILATITRSGNNWYLFINGNLEATQNSSVGFQSETGLVYIGCMLNSSSPSNFFNGYIDDLRITKGVARYTSNFNVPTRAFASVPCYGANLTPGVFTVPIVDGNLSLVIIDAPAITTAPIGNSNLSINTINTPATTTAPIANGNLSINTINTTSTLTPVFIGG